MECWPEFVVVPARRGPGGAEMETRRAAVGPGLVLPAFSSVPGLVRVLGRDRPWVCVRLRDAREAAGAAGLAGVVIDPQEMG